MTQLTAVLAPNHDRIYDHIDMLCRIVLTGTDTGGAFSIVEERAALGAITPQHVHTREAETFIVLEGALEGWCEGRTTLVEAGSMIHLPPGQQHAFRVASPSARFYTLITPSGFETFFADTGTPLAQAFEGDLPIPGPKTPEQMTHLQQVLEPLGVTITGPPPFAVG